MRTAGLPFGGGKPAKQRCRSFRSSSAADAARHQLPVSTARRFAETLLADILARKRAARKALIAA